MSENGIEEGQKEKEILKGLLGSKTKAFALLKPDAAQEGCVPMIMEILTENGFKIGNFEPVNLTQEDSICLYENDLRKTTDPNKREELMAGINNLVGECVVISLFHEYKDGRTAWERLSAVKGNAKRSGIRTIRGSCAFHLHRGFLGERGQLGSPRQGCILLGMKQKSNHWVVY